MAVSEAHLDACEAWLRVAELRLERLRTRGYAGNVPPVRKALGAADKALDAFDREWKASLTEVAK